MSAFYRDTGKRVCDIVAAVVLLVLLSPILLLTAAIVRVVLGSPVLFRQQRPGLRGEPFTLLKFRTMSNAVDSSGAPRPDHERLGALGRILRTSSVDELPELWNVLRGDMSLVGPRPLLMEYLPLYSAEQVRRHDVRPGITGWAQINGRNAISWDRRFELDVWYVDHVSAVLDARILFGTALRVLTRQGIAAEGHVSMPKFTGRGA
ncbi:MAG TPA: sugar transferase [Vicinamibacterales bacterium]|nr:sugar transferase [Vicinamibacterales bacterium]